MFEIYASALVVTGASLLVGTAILRVLGWPGSAWLAGATGFAALVVVAPFLVRLPGRGTTAAVLLFGMLVASAYVVRTRGGDGEAIGRQWPAGLAAALIVVLLASLPFLLNDRVGVLGEGIYTNDHAAQLYWADWLQHGFGPQPSAVRFGYPVGPQALAAIVSTATTIDLVAVFNGLLIAIAVLTALTALAALERFAAPARIGVAVLTGLTYLGASFLAQSAFKETAMALFVLAFALALARLSGRDADRAGGPTRVAVLALGAILAAASVFTFSLPGLAWFAIAVPLWLLLEALGGRSPIDYRAILDSVARHRGLAAVIGLVALVVAALAIGPAVSFVDRINDVQNSQGRLGSPIFPGEALGIWPAGDYRLVRGEVSGALLATALGLAAVAYGTWVLLRRRQLAILAMLGAGLVVYVGARLFAQIHVEAKALAVISPLVVLVALWALLAPGGRDGNPGPPPARVRHLLGGLVALAFLGSAFVALRAAPVGFDARGAALERLAGRAEGAPLVFLGLDRFAAYWLRDTLVRAPGGYVPQEIDNRPQKLWQQGLPVDFDSVESRKLDRFRYAITTAAAYQSAAPPNFTRVAEDGDYVLWRRQGETSRAEILDGEAGAPGVEAPCPTAGQKGSDPLTIEATVFATPPPVGDSGDWKGTGRVERAVGGQEGAFAAPFTVTNSVEIPDGGEYALSLQYQSQSPLTVTVDGDPVGEVPASLEGMYLDGAGRGAFWPVGAFDTDGGTVEVAVSAPDPGGLAGLLGAERRTWLGAGAATATGDPVERALAAPCGYVDHFTEPGTDS